MERKSCYNCIHRYVCILWNTICLTGEDANDYILTSETTADTFCKHFKSENETN